LAADDIVGVLKKIAANEQSIQTRDLWLNIDFFLNYYATSFKL
jgi:ferric iron reductase protein FhuF